MGKNEEPIPARAVAVEPAQSALFLLDTEGIVTSWNAGATALLGYEPTEMVGQDFSRCCCPEDPEAGGGRREIEAAASRGWFQGEAWCRAKDGRRVLTRLLITALYGAQGELAGFSVVAAASSPAPGSSGTDGEAFLLERLFDLFPDASVLVDREGAIRKVNRQFESLFGYRRAEILGKKVELLIPERFHGKHRHHLAGYFANPQGRPLGCGLQPYAVNREGAEFPVDIVLSPIDSDCALAVIRDSTPSLNSEDPIQALNVALQKQVDQLALANRELEAFSSSVAHDLRAPVRRIVGYLQLMDLSSLDPESRSYMQIVARATRDMGTLIDDLLSFSRLGRVELMKGRVNMSALVGEVVEELARETGGREIHWVVATLPEVTGDLALLRQVIINLVSNALKFTRGRIPAVIEIGTRRDGCEVLFFVRDNGAGFDMRHAHKMFGLFQRLHRGDQFEGTGVGLANVQRIIARHGGRTWAEGAVDAGATFWFSLPAAGEASSVPAAPTGQSPSVPVSPRNLSGNPAE